MDEENFLNDLRTAPWHVGNIFDSIDDQYHYWESLLNNILDDHAPLKKMRVRETDVPYMTTEWKAAIRKKRRYAKIFLNNPTQENRELKNKWRNTATKLRRKAIKEYWKTKTEEIKTNPKEFYKVFKPMLNTRAKGNDKQCVTLEIDGAIIGDQKTVAIITL